MLLMHVKDKHGGDRRNLKIQELAISSGDAMIRRVIEAVYINETTPVLNPKEEWGNKNAPRSRHTTTRAYSLVIYGSSNSSFAKLID